MFEMRTKLGRKFYISEELYDAILGDNWDPSDFEFADEDNQILLVTDEEGEALEEMSCLWCQTLDICKGKNIDREGLQLLAEVNGLDGYWACEWNADGAKMFQDLLEAVKES